MSIASRFFDGLEVASRKKLPEKPDPYFPEERLLEWLRMGIPPIGRAVQDDTGLWWYETFAREHTAYIAKKGVKS